MEKLKNEYNNNLHRFKRYMEFKQKEEYKQNKTRYEDEAYKILNKMDDILKELSKLGLRITKDIVENGFLKE